MPYPNAVLAAARTPEELAAVERALRECAPQLEQIRTRLRVLFAAGHLRRGGGR